MNIFEQQSAEFHQRHIGPNEKETQQMLQVIGEPSLESLINKTVPPAIRMQRDLNLPEAMSENEYLKHIKEVSLLNKVYKNYIGQGYYDTITPLGYSSEYF
ncbi:MAG: hypothetical protein NVV59_13320 [Chitinophagaceae bacterium]|nr:hypothetical protein [Chitinophagaceae bacterium]